jgi:rare lipoprotein A
MKPYCIIVLLPVLFPVGAWSEEATIHSLEQKELTVRDAHPLAVEKLVEENDAVAANADKKEQPGTEGIASWYGGKFQGRKTASGEVFDTRQYTAAHRTLPFGTIVRVVNLENGTSTIVRVNDRGPFVDNRIIDLSQAAAVELDMMKTGVARVRLEVQGASATAPVGKQVCYRIQAGSFKDKENARRMKELLTAKGYAVFFETGAAGQIRVLIDNVAQADLESVKTSLFALGVTKPLVRFIE